MPLLRTIANTPDALRSLCKKLAAAGAELHFAYEDGELLASGPPAAIQSDQRVIDAYLGAH